MFNWITKPYIEWNVLDTLLFYFEIGILCLIIIVISIFILELKDKIKNRKKNK